MGRFGNTVAAVAAVCVAIVKAPAAQAVPEVGMNGLCANASSLAYYISSNYPSVRSIGGVRQCDAIGDHCRGVAIDIMVGGNSALGDTIYGDLSTHMAAHSIRYLLWRVPKHFDHVHVTVRA